MFHKDQLQIPTPPHPHYHPPTSLPMTGACGLVEKAVPDTDLIVLSELRSYTNVEVAVLGSPFLIIRTVSLDVKQK